MSTTLWTVVNFNGLASQHSDLFKSIVYAPGKTIFSNMRRSCTERMLMPSLFFYSQDGLTLAELVRCMYLSLKLPCALCCFLTEGIGHCFILWKLSTLLSTKTVCTLVLLVDSPFLSFVVSWHLCHILRKPSSGPHGQTCPYSPLVSVAKRDYAFIFHCDMLRFCLSYKKKKNLQLLRASTFRRQSCNWISHIDIIAFGD